MGLLRAAAVAAAAIVVLVVVLTVLLTYIGLYRMSEYYARHVTVRTPRARLTEAYDSLKTGDVVLFVATTNSGTNSMLTQAFYSHGAVVLREGDLLYLSETQAGTELMPVAGAPDVRLARHAVITPLLTRLKYYTGVFYVMQLSRPLDPAREAALKREAERFRAEECPYPSVAQSVLGILGWRTRSRHCFQHVAALLDGAGLTPLDRGGAPLAEAGFLAVCGEVSGLAGRALPGGYAYAPPVQLLYDVDARQLKPPEAPSSPQQ